MICAKLPSGGNLVGASRRNHPVAGRRVRRHFGGGARGTILLIVGEIFALLWLFYGMWRLHHTLNPKHETKRLSPAHVPHALHAAHTAALPPHASVNEGTTERLITPERERAAVPLKPHKTDTAEI